MKYAVIQTGGKQYKVSPGDALEIEKIEGEKGDRVEFDKILLMVDGDKALLGQPTLKNAKVDAEIVGQKKGKKIRVVKFKAKSRYRKVLGHRQQLTKVKINKIV